MNKAQALTLVGKPVEAWTAANGCYLGELLEVLPTRPWRAKVRISSVLSAAQHYERGGVVRRGFREGEVIEVGNSSVKPAGEACGTDYLSALRADLAKHQAWLDRDPEGRYAWLHKDSIDALTQVMAAEERRLQTGEWQLHPARSGPHGNTTAS